MPAEPFCSNPKCDNHKLAAYPRQYETMKYEMGPSKFDLDYWEPGKTHQKEIQGPKGKIITRKLIHAYVGGQEVEGYLCEACVYALEMRGVV